MKAENHELTAAESTVNVGSDRGFGLVFTVAFALIGLQPLLSQRGPRWWALAGSVAFLLVALARPLLLAPLNRLWFRFGQLLHLALTPVILGIVFFLVVMPTGWLLRLFGKDPLRLRIDRTAGSYWIHRQPPGPAPDTMRHQF